MKFAWVCTKCGQEITALSEERLELKKRDHLKSSHLRLQVLEGRNG